MITPTKDWIRGAIGSVRFAFDQGLHRAPSDDDLAEWLMDALRGMTGPEIVDAVAASPEAVSWRETHRHQVLPPPEQWYPIETDLCGIRVPSIRPYGQTDVCFLPIYPCYPPEVRKDIRDALHARAYTHIVLDPRPKYPPIYPGKVCTVEEFRSILHEVVDGGLIPIVFWLPDDEPFEPAWWDAHIAPYLNDPEINALCPINTVAWEVNAWATPEHLEVAIRWLRARIAPTARLAVHFTPNHAAGSGPSETEQHWWARMAADNLVDDIDLQLDPGASVEDQTSRVLDFTTRLTGGLNAWPTRQADGSPLRVIVFEYDAYKQSRETLTEADGVARRRVFEVIPGVSGVADQP